MQTVTFVKHWHNAVPTRDIYLEAFSYNDINNCRSLKTRIKREICCKIEFIMLNVHLSNIKKLDAINVE